MHGLLLGLMLLATPAGAADPSTAARTLSALRAEVEALSARLAEEQEERSTRQRALAVQQAELEAQIRREELRLAQAEAALDRKREELAGSAAASEQLRPAVAQSFAAVDRALDSSLPYRLDERRRALQELRAQFDDGLLAPESAAARLWAFVEDERRLARENSLDRQVIVLDGQELLVQVARLGQVALLFQAEDGRCGWAARGAGGWTWTATTDAADRARITAIFEDLGKQIRVGWFEVPGPAIAHLERSP